MPEEANIANAIGLEIDDYQSKVGPDNAAIDYLEIGDDGYCDSQPNYGTTAHFCNNIGVTTHVLFVVFLR